MEDLVIRIVVFALVGAVSGFLSGLFGVGGGIIRIPIFLRLLPLFGVTHPVVMHVAVGTSIALVLPAAIAATRKQIAIGNLDLSYYRTWAIGILFGALIGNLLLPHVSTEILTIIFSILILTVAVYEGFLKGRLTIAKEPPIGATKLAVATGVGCVAALTGTAGGTVTTPILQAFGTRIEAAIATSSATGLVTGSMGTIGAILAGWQAPGLPTLSLGYVDLVIFAVMLPTTILAAPVGVRVGQMLSETRLRLAFTVLLFIIAADLILKLIA
jgi:uncharacterized membrane protein YfcA